ncbi:tyrosine-type recombinase/integrase [Halorussus lipolyticus]|uniref:tyrosine-type recombinase/integrase n=1 Tax=Halorussus lipolyticus TaxID=3034024 RepID=UPI0023E78633|nr:site-specific integrase [Halorussus sp. DT80]
MSDDLEPIAPEAAVDLYIDHRRDEVSDETLQSHRYRLKQFVLWCEEEGITNMNDVSGRDLHAFRVHRREDADLELVSLQGQLSTLRVFLGFCASIDAVPEGLRNKVMLPTVSDSEQASKTNLEPDRAEAALDYLERYHYASRNHVILLLLWRTGMRSGALRSLDLDDFDWDEPAVELVHRPEEDTPLKNAENSQRWVALSEHVARVVKDYRDGPREDVTDDYGRRPVLTTSQGRASRSTVRNSVYLMTRPCWYGDGCPHDRDIGECEATERAYMSKCPSSRSPHDVRSGAITAHLLEDVPVEIVSDRMDVTQDVLDKHYDRRSEREKMNQRRDHLGI